MLFMDLVQTTPEAGIWIVGIIGFLVFVHSQVFQWTQRYGNCIYLRRQMKVRETPSLLGQLRRAKITLSSGPSRVGVYHPVAWWRKQIRLQKRGLRIPDDVQSPKTQESRASCTIVRTLYNSDVATNNTCIFLRYSSVTLSLHDCRRTTPIYTTVHTAAFSVGTYCP
jgi:hypothetical protein